MKNKKNKGFTLIELLVVISIIGVLAGMGIASFRPIQEKVRKMQSDDKMKQLYRLMFMYAGDYGSFPTAQPSATRYEKGGGVKDLYPLYETGIMGKEQLKLLQAPGAALIPFSDDPTIDEFNENHIGYAYNSTAMPDDPDNPPLLSEQGVSSGKLSLKTSNKGKKAIFANGCNVLFCSGISKWIPANKKTGKLSTKEVSAEQWGLLQD